MNYLLEKELVNHYIVYPKYVAWFFMIISVILLIFSLINSVLWIVFFLFLFVTVIFLMLYFFNKKVYGNKIVIEENVFQLYNMNGKLLRVISLNDMKRSKHIINFYGPRNYCNKKECLIFFQNLTLYEGMEYKSYWKDKNILIVQNPELILFLVQNKIIDNNIS